ncbi:hypothetical protein NP493_1109g00016 [Ridgeia piscesae]|uniref:EF-hand domain-containing protein n=1 Tax=Ridgeia piscesae TaxID=27915 RepID=A0AAD9KH58_RIDPI|nr:hypothetical protein NP493_1109g00016 [Ridgeia piscesae]
MATSLDMGDGGDAKAEMKKKTKAQLAATPMEKLREAALRRGVNGIQSMGRAFRIFDDNGNSMLDYKEFRNGLREFGVQLSPAEMKDIFDSVDIDNSGTIDFDEFILALRPPMSKARKNLIDQAFDKLDKTQDGVVTVEDIERVYDVRQHAKYKSGQWTEKKVLQEFLKTFEIGGVVDSQVTREEFHNYYAGVSASIDTDVYFDLMMRTIWKL